MGNFEEYFMFTLQEEEFTETLLLAGRCREPKVFFTEAHITMNPTVLGVESTSEVMLRNEEKVPLNFTFSADSLFCRDFEQQLQVVPMIGSIMPETEQKIK